MRVNDAVIGAVLLVLALAVVWHVQDFPKIPGQPYGVALYPFTVGVGLAIVSVLLIVTGLRSRAPMLALERTDSHGPGGERRIAAFVATVASLFFYLFFADRLVFLVCSTVMLVAMFWTYGVRRALVVPLAVAATLFIHFGFYKLLKVPLPWGVLQAFAW